jgi:hypothetical protein
MSQLTQGLPNLGNLSNISNNLQHLSNTLPAMPNVTLPNKLFQQKTLHDLIKGLRAHKDSEAQYVADCLAEIREELKSDQASVKGAAVAKLTYVCNNNATAGISRKRSSAWLTLTCLAAQHAGLRHLICGF